MTGKVGQLIDANEKRQETLRKTVADGLEKLQADNSDKLEKMRATVEEKLQGMPGLKTESITIGAA